MATNRKLKADLLKKLGITEQALNQRAQKLKLELPMTTEQAYYVIAHDERLNLPRYLSSEQIGDVRDLVRDLKAARVTSPERNGGGRRRAASAPTAPKKTLVTIAGMTDAELPGMTARHVAEARQMAEKVYPMLYLFENSVRDVIERVLKAAHGPDWWTKAVHTKIQAKAADRKAQEGNEPWHGRRGARPIDYVDLADLWRVIKDNWPTFKPFFPPGPAWVETLITSDMNVSRRPLAHMNPLAPDDVESVTHAFRKWVKVLKAVEAQLP